MTYPIFILLGILALALVAIVIVLVSPTASPEEKSLPQGESISVETQGSIVTVRKIGRVTSVSIHDGIRDHWEGPDGVPISPLSPESTRYYYPELYDEYMSPSTSAIRKREIIDEVYAMDYRNRVEDFEELVKRHRTYVRGQKLVAFIGPILWPYHGHDVKCAADQIEVSRKYADGFSIFAFGDRVMDLFGKLENMMKDE